MRAPSRGTIPREGVVRRSKRVNHPRGAAATVPPPPTPDLDVLHDLPGQAVGPGLYAVIPLLDWVRVVDARVQALEIARQQVITPDNVRQQVITRDNVPVALDGVLFFRVVEAALAVTRVQDFRFAVFQYARTSLRDVVGQMTLDELLSEREQIEATIGSHVEKDTLDVLRGTARLLGERRDGAGRQ